MARIGGTCYFKIDGQQLSLTGGDGAHEQDGQ